MKLGYKPTRVHIKKNHRIILEKESSKVNKGQYYILLGKLIYSAYTRPELAYAVSVISQFMNNQNERHL